jgi:paraquat-inducible protein B
MKALAVRFWRDEQGQDLVEYALIVAAVLFFGSGSIAEKRLPMVSFFHGSVAGLRVGAPVTFRGVRIGEFSPGLLATDPAGNLR